MRYLIYDVETPNRYNNSICACAWMLHDGTKALDYACQLINPHADFDAMNISIHHISSDDVADAPSFAEYWKSTLKDLFASAIIVAHNARFDLSVTEKALCAAGIDAPCFDYIDTLQFFRTMLPNASCKLPDLAAMYGYSYQAHDAGEDVRALCVVLDRFRNEVGFSDYDSMFHAARKQKEKPQAGNGPKTYAEYVALVDRFYSEIKANNIDLSDIHFAFHGELQDPPINRRNGLDEIIKALGGTFHKSVCKKLDYYVCFDDVITGTVAEARALAAIPENHIQIINTAEFFALLGYRTVPNRAGPEEIRRRKHQEREAKEAVKREIEAARAAKKARKAESKPPKVESKPFIPKGRAIRQLDLDGNIIGEFPSISIAAATVGTNTKSISDALSGKQRTAGGYRWVDIEKEM